MEDAVKMPQTVTLGKPGESDYRTLTINITDEGMVLDVANEDGDVYASESLTFDEVADRVIQ